LALRAHNVSVGERQRIRRAVWQRLNNEPLSFLWPAKEVK
jgi:site-specific recombinase